MLGVVGVGIVIVIIIMLVVMDIVKDVKGLLDFSGERLQRN